MAILWCDPYIESPSGGVDGTTGVGTLGTYTNPYSLNTLPVNVGYVAGDEVRLKSLPTASTSINTVLTGTIDPTASTAVVGVGTLFTTELVVGDSILVTGETREVTVITDNLNLTVSVAFTDVLNDTTPERVRVGAWLTGPLFDGGASDQYALQCTVAPDVGSFIKYTDKDGDIIYTSWNTLGRTYLQAQSHAWQGLSPYADTTQLMYKLDPQYYISNMANINQNYFIRGQDSVVTTLTAGWVSETARGGETIIQHIQPGNSQHYWFGSTSISLNKMIVDAPELTISQSHSSTSRKIDIGGDTVEVKNIIERSGAGSSNYIRIRTAGTFKAFMITTGSYIWIYNPYNDNVSTQGINRDIKHILSGYTTNVNVQNATSPISHLKFKSLNAYYYYRYTATKWSYYNSFYVNLYQGFQLSNTLEEMAFDANITGVTDVNKLFYRPVVMLGAKFNYGDNHNYRNYTAGGIQRDGIYLLGGAVINPSYGDVMFREYRMPAGDTLEGSTYNNIYGYGGSSSNYYQGTAWGVDRNSGRRLAFVRGNLNTDQAMMMYNSTEYGGKLVYHLLANPTTSYFRNRIDMAMPTGVSVLDGVQAYKLKITLAGTTVGSVSLNTLRLEGNSNPDINWTTLPTAPALTIDAATGGAGTIIYSGTFSNTANLAGIQLFSLLAQFRNNSTTAVAKICFESIELVVV